MTLIQRSGLAAFRSESALRRSFRSLGSQGNKKEDDREFRHVRTEAKPLWKRESA